MCPSIEQWGNRFFSGDNHISCYDRTPSIIFLTFHTDQSQRSTHCGSSLLRTNRGWTTRSNILSILSIPGLVFSYILPHARFVVVNLVLFRLQ